MSNWKNWAACLLIGAMLVWIPLELMLGVVPHVTVKEFLAHQAFGNVVQAFAALGSFAAVVAALWIAGEGDRQRRLDARNSASGTLMTRAALVNFAGLRVDDLARCIEQREDGSGFVGYPDVWNQAVDDLGHASRAIESLTLRDIGTVEELLRIQRARAHIAEIAPRYAVVNGDNTNIALAEKDLLEEKAGYLLNIAKGLAEIAEQQREGRFVSVGEAGSLDHFSVPKNS